MSSKILKALLETGISFEENNLGTTDYRLNLMFRDSNLPKGEGYKISVQIGETRGNVILSFESFSTFLLSEAKKLLEQNIVLLKEFNFSGEFSIDTGKEKFSLSNNLDDLEKHLSAGDFEIVYESTMRDLRKEEELSLLIEEIIKVSEMVVFAILPYDLDSFGEIEGKKFEVTTTKYERSRKNRALCLAHYGYSCQICNFNFEKTYGQNAKNYIHVHHIEQISDAGVKKIDPLVDLIPLCPNCHSVAHLKKPPYTPEELREMIEG